MLYEFSVPPEKLELFHSLLCNSKGHYCSIPELKENNIYVHVEITEDSDFFHVCSNLKLYDRRKKPRTVIQRIRYQISHLIHLGK